MSWSPQFSSKEILSSEVSFSFLFAYCLPFIELEWNEDPDRTDFDGEDTPLPPRPERPDIRPAEPPRTDLVIDYTPLPTRP
jgi:hypothetical protein